MGRSNESSKGPISARDYKVKDAQGAFVQHIQKGSVARTDTVAKNLFQLPANAIIDDIIIGSPNNSDAGTTATLSVGKTGTNTFFINGLDVKTAASGKGYPLLSGATAPTNVYGTTPLAAALQVVGIYAETGGASTTGGPWDVQIYYHYAQ